MVRAQDDADAGLLQAEAQPARTAEEVRGEEHLRIALTES